MFPAETTASASFFPTRGDERAVRLRPHRLGRLLVHLDLLRRLDELEALRVEPGGAVEDRLDRIGRRFERAGDDFVRRAVAAKGVDGNPDHFYGLGVRSGSISRPPYVLHVGHMRCGRFGEPHCGHRFSRGASIRCVARRLSRRDLEVFFFGTAIGGAV